MKNLLIYAFLLIGFSFGNTQLIAQSDQGTLTMEIIDVSSDNEQVAAGLEMMKGTVMTVHYKGKESLSKLNMMGGMVKTDIKMNAAGDMDMYMYIYVYV